eukprot:3591110-Pleurochrysis_carterae.AAC.4
MNPAALARECTAREWLRPATMLSSAGCCEHASLGALLFPPQEPATVELRFLLTQQIAHASSAWAEFGAASGQLVLSLASSSRAFVIKGISKAYVFDRQSQARRQVA